MVVNVAIVFAAVVIFGVVVPVVIVVVVVVVVVDVMCLTHIKSFRGLQMIPNFKLWLLFWLLVLLLPVPTVPALLLKNWYCLFTVAVLVVSRHGAIVVTRHDGVVVSRHGVFCDHERLCACCHATWCG